MSLFKNKLLLTAVCLFIQSMNVVQAKTWVVELLVKADIYAYPLYFGIDSLGTDGFDAGLDMLAPPPPPTFYAYLWSDSFPNWLYTDIRGPTDTSITWVLSIVNATGFVDTIAWAPNELPSEGNFNFADTLDMRLYDSVVYTGNQTLTIRYTSSNLGYEELGESQSNVFLIDYGYANPVTATNTKSS